MDSFGMLVCLTELCIQSTADLCPNSFLLLSIFKVQCGLKIAHSVGPELCCCVFVGRFFGKEFTSNGGRQ